MSGAPSRAGAGFVLVLVDTLDLIDVSNGLLVEAVLIQSVDMLYSDEGVDFDLLASSLVVVVVVVGFEEKVGEAGECSSGVGVGGEGVECGLVGEDGGLRVLVAVGVWIVIRL